MGHLTYNYWRNADGTPKAEYVLNRFSDTPVVMKHLNISLISIFTPTQKKTKEQLVDDLNTLKLMSGLNKTELEIGLAKEHPLVSVNDEEFKNFKSIVENLSTRIRNNLQKAG